VAELPEETCDIGYPSPFTPTNTHLRASRAGLAMHRRGEFAEAASAFAAVAADAPGYGSARFNLACAQTRAGQLEDAKTTLTQLFCEDLPTNLPRALSDEDLEPLRADIEALGSALVRRYREASAGGVSLVAFGRTGLGDGDPAEGYPETELLWSQPGLWQSGRFVPAGPRQQRRSTGSPEPMFPSFVAEDRVVQVDTVSSSAEADFLPPLRVIERSLFDGVVRSDERFDESQNDFYGVFMGVHDGQTYVRFDPRRNEPAPHRTLDLSTRRVMPNPPMQSARIGFGMSQWTTIDRPSNLMLSGRTLHHGTQSIEVDARHRRMHGKRVLAAAGVAIVHSSNVGDCGHPDQYLVEVMDLETGATLWKEHGEGQRLLQFHDDQLWMQTNDAFFVFEDPRQNERTQLPAGLGLSSLFLAFNPMC
jgi:hypothetical protein